MDMDFFNSDFTVNDQIDNANEESFIPDCLPSKLHPKDLERAMGKSQAEIDALGIQRYYASEIIGIKSNEPLPTNTFNKDYSKMSSEEQKEFREFIIKISTLIDANDSCDKEGIKFIAQIMNSYCLNSEAYNMLSSPMQEFIKGLFLKDKEITKAAAQISNC